jgi:hypothetical protein
MDAEGKGEKENNFVLPDMFIVLCRCERLARGLPSFQERDRDGCTKKNYNPVLPSAFCPLPLPVALCLLPSAFDLLP